MSHFHLITTSARSTLCGFKLSASLVASCAQLCLHKRSSLKMPHRGISFTVGFKSLRILGRSKLKAPMKGAFSFGLPEGIWTPILRNRNPLRYPIAPRADVCGRVFCLPFFIFWRCPRMSQLDYYIIPNPIRQGFLQKNFSLYFSTKYPMNFLSLRC